MAVPGAASAPAVRGPPAPLLCRAPSIPHGLIRSARVGAGLKRPGWCSGGGLGEANEFHGLDSCRDGGRRVPAPWPWKGGSLAAPKAPGPPNLEPKCRGRRSRPPSSKAPTFFWWGGGHCSFDNYDRQHSTSRFPTSCFTFFQFKHLSR